MHTARPSQSPTGLLGPAYAGLHMVRPRAVEVDTGFGRQRQHPPAPEPVEVAEASAFAAVAA
jgi:hypothetical protein